MRLGAIGVVALAMTAACGGERSTADGAAHAATADSARPAGESGRAAGRAPGRILATIGDSASHIEGIAAHGGKLYVADWKDGAVYRIDPASPTPERVGQLPTKPGQVILGLVTDSAGNLYAAVPDDGVIYRIAAGRLGAPDFAPAKDAMRFATGAPGANGINFAPDGHLWIGGGEKHALYHVGPNGGNAVEFARDYSPEATDTAMPVRVYTVNGVVPDGKGNVYSVNTGTGEVVRLEVKPGFRRGTVTSVVKSPELIGADGLTMDQAGTLWIACNFGNAVARVTPDGKIDIVATNGANVPPGERTLRFPAELKRIGTTVYLANLNFPIGRNAGTPPGATIAAVEVR